MAAAKRKAAPDKASVSGRDGAKKPKIVVPALPDSDSEQSSTDDDKDASDSSVPINDEHQIDQVDGGNAEQDEGIHPSRLAPTNLPTSTASKESHAKQKILAQERRASKPNADLIQRSKKIWERLRRKSHVPRDERKELVAELYSIITGNTKDFVLKHDATRVIQTAIKYGNLDQRRAIAQELKGEYQRLAESRYAKFLIGKLVVSGGPDTRDLVIPEFYGKIRGLIKHPEASWIVDDIYRGIATPAQKATMLREWYGPEFALFKAENASNISSTLSEILAKSPEKRTPIMRYLLDLINLLIQKKTTGFTMLHDAMLQYMLNLKSDGEEMSAFIEMIKGDEEGDLLKNLAFTPSGAKVVCLALANGSAKDRKHILRTYKDTVSLLSYDAHGHLVILAAYDIIDDTVLTTKCIFPELLGKDEAAQEEHVMNALSDLNARKALLYLFAGCAKWLLSDEEVSFLSEIRDLRNKTSKKDAEARRQELLKGLSRPLHMTIEKRAKDICQTTFGCQFVTEVLLHDGGEASGAFDAVADLAAGDPMDAGHLAQSAAAGRMFKTLALGGKFNAKLGRVETRPTSQDFHRQLYARIKPNILQWATGPSSFVVLGILDAEQSQNGDEAKKSLSKHKKALEKASRSPAMPVEQHDNQGKQQGKGIEKSKPLKGNMGAKLILEKLV
ncbi:MAG: hypothetical protein M1825_004246 [Sarcosagium campestre]|nr:MAG: hypothetical protein M1825_004246 [Sarcosagium campestre]